MTMSCIIRGCRSRSYNIANQANSEHISFHRFPKDDETRNKWFAATSRNKEQYKVYWKVCSRHFAPTNFIDGNLLRPYLKDYSVPTLNLPNKSNIIKIESCYERQEIDNDASNNKSHQQLLPGRKMLAPDPLPASSRRAPLSPCALSKRQSNQNRFEDRSPMIAKEAVMEAIYKGRIDKLEKKITKLELIAKQRLLTLKAKKEQIRRLMKKNADLLEKLDSSSKLEKEKINKEKIVDDGHHMMLERVKSVKGELVLDFSSKVKSNRTVKSYIHGEK